MKVAETHALSRNQPAATQNASPMNRDPREQQHRCPMFTNPREASEFVALRDKAADQI